MLTIDTIMGIIDTEAATGEKIECHGRDTVRTSPRPEYRTTSNELYSNKHYQYFENGEGI